ncbi:hypothetical protein [Saccharopolyspora erythraea]|uniref:Uncharacterized protein n=2 Tax=Saccharopolyspora erythraea TaxID=1836 RepID=A4FPN1_SACEN|nr:hypothetical protein [Saccharopolyspora erythraea]EQD85854.1 hypothetical protein N599_12920 [Saccharopolyspora erythraea D]QRK89538.1 hypothetical protein JQX30_34240 [Saccharopolyspora erythraea]CAM06006.1 hypothetical protein SACE_6842 [Saccharopolyspora erythraea NRRL 2338]
MGGVTRELDYDGSPVVVLDVVGLPSADVIAAGVAVVAAGPGDEPRPLRDDCGPVVRRPGSGSARPSGSWSGPSRSGANAQRGR